MFDDVYAKKHRLVMDGPMGTELERRGYDVNDALWSAKFLKENPDAIRQIHYDYLKAGADIITCASYQASVAGFTEHGYTKEEAEELIVRSLQLAKEAREMWWESEGCKSGRVYPLIAGDIGPYGAYLADGSEYTGGYDLTPEEYRSFHFRRMELLKEAGADIFAVETMPKVEEARACANMLEELGCDYWISFSFRNSDQISDGTKISEVVEKLQNLPHLKAIGVNCTPLEYVMAIIRNYRKYTELPICVYPNSGEIYDGITKTWHGSKDGLSFADSITGWMLAGADLIGGCCRTRPEDIHAIAEAFGA